MAPNVLKDRVKAKNTKRTGNKHVPLSQCYYQPFLGGDTHFESKKWATHIKLPKYRKNQIIAILYIKK